MKNIASGGALEAYEALVSEGVLAVHATRVAAMKRDFEARTGAFGPEDAWFEARSRALWDDAVTRMGFGRIAESAKDPRVAPWITPFERAHRGLFRATRTGNVRVLVDVWSGAEFVLHAAEQGLRDALDAASGLFDGRLVARDSPLEVALLPGAVFHPADATEPIERVIAVARASKLDTRGALDVLLKMEHSLRALSRVKAAYAYRVEKLARLGETTPPPATKRLPD